MILSYVVYIIMAIKVVMFNSNNACILKFLNLFGTSIRWKVGKCFPFSYSKKGTQLLGIERFSVDNYSNVEG